MRYGKSILLLVILHLASLHSAGQNRNPTDLTRFIDRMPSDDLNLADNTQSRLADCCNGKDRLYFDLSRFPELIPSDSTDGGAYCILAADTLDLDTLTFFSTAFYRRETFKGAAKSFTPLVPEGKWQTIAADHSWEWEEYRNGKKTGAYEWHYSSGKLHLQGQYENAHPVGLWTNYHPNGKLKREVLWRDGKLRIITVMDSNGIALVSQGQGEIHRLYRNPIKVVDSVKAGTNYFATERSACPSYAMDFMPDGSVVGRMLKAGDSLAIRVWGTNAVDMRTLHLYGIDSLSVLPDPDEGQGFSIIPIALNMDSIRKTISYPPRAKEGEIQGRVEVQLLVDEKGAVRLGYVARDPHPLLTQAVMSSNLGALRFTPGGWPGEPAACWVKLPFEFKLVR